MNHMNHGFVTLYSVSLNPIFLFLINNFASHFVCVLVVWHFADFCVVADRREALATLYRLPMMTTTIAYGVKKIDDLWARRPSLRVFFQETWTLVIFFQLSPDTRCSHLPECPDFSVMQRWPFFFLLAVGWVPNTHSSWVVYIGYVHFGSSGIARLRVCQPLRLHFARLSVISSLPKKIIWPPFTSRDL